MTNTSGLRLKGRLGKSALGSWSEAEIELAWSPEAFDKLSNLLARHGLFISGLQERRILEDPLDVLKDAGLIVIQKRQTVRTVRHVRSTKKDLVLAETCLGPRNLPF